MRPLQRLFLRLLVALSLTACAVADSTSESLLSGGYQEAVFSVSDAAEWVAFLEEVAGWDVLHDGELDPAMLAGWQLPSEASAREVVVGNPGTKRGFIRLLQFRGVEQQQIRSNAQSWDTGGWFDVNSRVVSMEKKFSELQARDWQAASDPVEFEFGPFVVREWLARGPDGIVIALIERVQPPLEGHPQLREMGRLINATQIVSDIDKAREFYLDKLGFKTYLDHVGASKSSGPNVLGLPHNVAVDVVRHVSILHPHAVNEGSVELLQFAGATGADFSARAVPPNLGVLMLRFPVRDIARFAQHVEEQGIEIAMSPQRVALPPYGDVTMMAIRGPDGVWIEFFTEE